jgi:hypothetical protein
VDPVVVETYQVQNRPDLDPPWSNFGVPYGILSATVPATNRQAYFAWWPDDTDSNQVVFNALESDKHTHELPSNANFPGWRWTTITTPFLARHGDRPVKVSA